MLEGVGAGLFVTGLRVVVSFAGSEPLDMFELALLLAATTTAGAVAGATYFFTEGLRGMGGWRKTVANTLSLLTYCLAAAAALIAAAIAHR
jgi:hypothetical protein